MIAIYISFVFALIFGCATWYARYILNDKNKTQMFALIAAGFTIAFIILCFEL